MTVFFVDSFQGHTLDQTKWSAGFPGDPSGQMNWPLSDDQWLNANIIVDGKLRMVLTKDSKTYGATYGGAIITSYNKFHAYGGWIQAQCAMPAHAHGLWPAFWLLPASSGSGRTQNWEVDMEYLGKGNTIYFTLHKGDKQIGQWTVENDELHLMHNYTFNWAPGKFLEFRFDNHVIGRVTDQFSVPNEPMFILFDIDTGGWNDNKVDSSTKFPSEMSCNYVAVVSN